LFAAPFVPQRLELFVAKERGSDYELLTKLVEERSLASTLTLR
jgi:hypothetical protein